MGNSTPLRMLTDLSRSSNLDLWICLLTEIDANRLVDTSDPTTLEPHKSFIKGNASQTRMS